MPHKFDPKHAKKLEDPNRFQDEPFSELLPLLDLGSKKTIIDLGCGTGFYTFPLAHFTPRDAVVYALDISQEMLDGLQRNMESGEIVKPLDPQDVMKIKPLKIKENEYPVPNNSIDLIFCSKVFHEFENVDRFLHETSQVLSPNGTLFIFDWKKVPTEKGPPLEHRIDYDDGISILKKNGYHIIHGGFIFHNFYYLLSKRV
jgi:SAM-dependent methyltransferase